MESTVDASQLGLGTNYVSTQDHSDKSSIQQNCQGKNIELASVPLELPSQNSEKTENVEGVAQNALQNGVESQKDSGPKSTSFNIADILQSTQEINRSITDTPEKQSATSSDDNTVEQSSPDQSGTKPGVPDVENVNDIPQDCVTQDVPTAVADASVQNQNSSSSQSTTGNNDEHNPSDQRTQRSGVNCDTLEGNGSCEQTSPKAKDNAEQSTDPQLDSDQSKNSNLNPETPEQPNDAEHQTTGTSAKLDGNIRTITSVHDTPQTSDSLRSLFDVVNSLVIDDLYTPDNVESRSTAIQGTDGWASSHSNKGTENDTSSTVVSESVQSVIADNPKGGTEKNSDVRNRAVPLSIETAGNLF